MLEKDGSWGLDMGVIRGLGTCALMWALLSESQDVLLTQTINQVSPVWPCVNHTAAKSAARM